MERNSLKSVVMTVISCSATLAGIAFFLSITATPGSAYMLVLALPLLFTIRLSASRSARQRPEAARKERLRNIVWIIAAALSVGINIFNYYHARHEMAVSATAFGQYYARHGRYPETLAAAGLGGKISCLRYHWIDGKPLLLCKDPLLLFEHYQYDFQHRRWLEDNGEPVADQPEDET